MWLIIGPVSTLGPKGESKKTERDVSVPAPTLVIRASD